MGTLKVRYPSGQWSAILGSGYDAANTARWNSAWGFIASQKSASSSWSNATSTLSDITAGALPNSVTAYLYASRKYRIYFQAQFLDTAAGASEFVVLQPNFNGVTYSENNALNMPVANIGIFTWYETIYTPAADGNVTFKMQGRRGSSSTGTVSITNANNAPLLYMIEDLGPITPASIAPPTAGPRVVASGNALGIVAFGALDTTVTTLPASTSTKTTLTLSCFTAVGRRYRINFVMRATSAASQAYAACQLYKDGSGQYPVVGDRYMQVTTPGYCGVNVHWYVDGDDATHTWDVYMQPGTVAVATYPAPGGLFYIEDVGPNTYPALPLPTTYQAWTPITNFQNNWVNFDTARTAQYRKIGDEVKMRGVVKGGTVGYGTPMFNLPVGFRPVTGRDEDWVVRAAGAPANLTVFANGNVSVVDNTGGQSVTYVYLNGVSFSTTA